VTSHTQLDDLDLYALGALDPAEQQEIAAHLAGCAECRQNLEAAHGRMALIGLAAPASVPAAAVRQRLLNAISSEAEPQPFRPRSLPLTPFRKLQRQGAQWFAWYMTIAAMLLAGVTVGLLHANRSLRHQVANLTGTVQHLQTEAARALAMETIMQSPQTLKVTLVPAGGAPVPQGKALYHPRIGLMFFASNLPALPPQKTYELWIIPSRGAPVPAGTFRADAQGNGHVMLPPNVESVSAKAFAVTIEPAGGVLAPTGEKVLVGIVS
jgi:anti-sigma-K factor RskA